MIIIRKDDEGQYSAYLRNEVHDIDGTDLTKEVPHILQKPSMAVKKPIPVEARLMPEEFAVETLEGGA